MFHQEDDPDNYYIVYSGRCSVIKYGLTEQHETVFVLETGDGFGNMAIKNKTTR